MMFLFSGSLSDSLFIDPESGRINVTQNISEAGHFYVTAATVIEEVLYDDRTRVRETFHLLTVEVAAWIILI